jgi:hypothetical protein
VLIDPGAEAEKERGPSEDPVQHGMVSDGLVIGYSDEIEENDLFRVTMMRPARNMPEVASPSNQRARDEMSENRRGAGKKI